MALTSERGVEFIGILAGHDCDFAHALLLVAISGEKFLRFGWWLFREFRLAPWPRLTRQESVGQLRTLNRLDPKWHHGITVLPVAIQVWQGHDLFFTDYQTALNSRRIVE